MHIYQLDRWRHSHQFHQQDAQNERNTLRVVLLTVIMMGIEITAGSVYGSMALLADGWHMGTHAAALGITLLAYIYARRLANDCRFTFGTGKMGVLGGFSSAIVLLMVALLMAFEALQRLLSPRSIQFNEAILVAGVGLAVNLLSAFLLKDHHHHGHEDDHHHAHEDHNLKAAYLHVVADALTSILAIAALLAGKVFGWVWLDAVMGMVGAAVITRWSVGLLRETGSILLDRSADRHLMQAVQQLIEADADNRLVDLHIWKVSSFSYAVALSLVTHFPRPVGHYKSLLSSLGELVHLTVEVQVCADEPCVVAEPSFFSRREN